MPGFDVFRHVEGQRRAFDPREVVHAHEEEDAGDDEAEFHRDREVEDHRQKEGDDEVAL